MAEAAADVGRAGGSAHDGAGAGPAGWDLAADAVGSERTRGWGSGRDEPGVPSGTPALCERIELRRADPVHKDARSRLWRDYQSGYSVDDRLDARVVFTYTRQRNSDVAAMSHAIAKVNDPIERVLVLVNNERFQLASPFRVQSTDYIYQTLRLEVGEMTNATLYVAQNARVGVSSDVLDQELDRRLFHEAGNQDAQIPCEVREKLGVSIETACTGKRGLELLTLSVNLCSSGHFTCAKAVVANSSRVATLDSCEVPVSIAPR